MAMVSSRGSGLSSSCLRRVRFSGAAKERVVQPAVPVLQLLLDAFGAHDGAAVRQVHVLFEIPAQVS